MRRSRGVSVTRIVAVLAALAAAFLILGNIIYTRVPPSRIAGSELPVFANDWRDIVEANARQTSSLNGSGAGIKSPIIIETKHGPVELSVDGNGTITAKNAKFQQSVVLTPQLRAGSVSWVCKGSPANDMSQSCR
jgi:hypothetical protein